MNKTNYWKTPTNLAKPIIRVNGGKERCHSVLNALQILQQQVHPDDGIGQDSHRFDFENKTKKLRLGSVLFENHPALKFIKLFYFFFG